MSAAKQTRPEGVTPSRKGTVAHKIDALARVVDAWLAADPRLKASVIHERLVAEHGFEGHYQRVKLYVAEARQRLARDGEVDDRLSGCIAGSRLSRARRPRSTGATKARSCSRRGSRGSTRST